MTDTRPPVAPVVTETAVFSACLEVDRLEKELDITNADYIALWLASAGKMSISFLACRIADAYDRTRDGEIERLRAALKEIASAKRVSLDGVVVFEGWSEFADRLREIARTALQGDAP